MKVWTGFGVMQCHAIFWTRSRKRPDRRRIVLIARTTRKAAEMGLRLASDFLRFQHRRMRRYSRAFFSRIEPVRKPCGSRSTCHCHLGLSNYSAVEKMPPKVGFAKQKQLAQKTVGSRDRCTSRLCSGLVGGMAQGCNIRSPVALA
jgi:hypothetical protein